jgi:alkylation response protein AidB-like acyl-CoA dehydrogenase
VALGPCRAAVGATAAHLKSARFEHLNQTLGESLPTLRAQIAAMRIDTDGLSSQIDDPIDHVERPRETTMLRTLETKAAAGDTAIAATSAAMRACGGAAFSKHTSIERLFRDAHAGAVMAATGDILRDPAKPSNAAELLLARGGDPGAPEVLRVTNGKSWRW